MAKNDLFFVASSVTEFVQSLAHQDQVCVKGASACSHTVDIRCSAVELNREVRSAVLQFFNEHLPLDGTLLRLSVREGRVYSNCAHRYLGVSLTREGYLYHATER